MKNRFFRNAAILFILMASIFANAGCSSDETGDTSNTGKAYLRFSLVGDSARTIVPTDVTESEINKVELKCTKSGSEVSVFNSTWNSIYEMYYDTIHEIEVGVYDFSLYLYVNDRLCQKASITERIISAGTNTLNFTAAYVEDGYGDLSLTLQWNDDRGVGYVKAGLYELDATTPVKDCYEESLRKSGDNYVVYEKSNLLKGNYFVIFKLYDSDGTLLNTVSDIVKIESALVTTKTDFVNDINTRYTTSNESDNSDDNSDYKWLCTQIEDSYENTETSQISKSCTEYKYLYYNSAYDYKCSTIYGDIKSINIYSKEEENIYVMDYTYKKNENNEWELQGESNSVYYKYLYYLLKKSSSKSENGRVTEHEYTIELLADENGVETYKRAQSSDSLYYSVYEFSDNRLQKIISYNSNGYSETIYSQPDNSIVQKYYPNLLLGNFKSYNSNGEIISETQEYLEDVILDESQNTLKVKVKDERDSSTTYIIRTYKKFKIPFSNE